MTKRHSVTLSSLRDGALNEMFESELKTVLENVMDVNMQCKKKREIIIKIEIVPRDENRDFVHVEASCDSKLAPPIRIPLVTSLSIGHERLGDEIFPVAYEIEGGGQNQLSLLTTDEILKRSPADDFVGRKEND